MLMDAQVHNFDHIVSWLPDLPSEDRHIGGIDRFLTPQQLAPGIPEVGSAVSHRTSSSIPQHDYFKVHNPKRFCAEVMPKYFNQSKYKSFLRQLQNYGFARVIKGPNRGVCRHPFFIKNQRSLTNQIKRVNRAASPSEMDVLPKSPVRKSRSATATRKSNRRPKMSPVTQKSMQKTQTFELSLVSFQVDPEICKIPPCEILFLDPIMPTSCASSSALEAIPFHGQQFFVV